MSWQVEIEPLGELVEVEEGQSILDAALRSGVYLPHACGHGLCGTCKVQVLEGEVEHGDASPFALMDMERDEGKCLACTAVPLSDLIIEADIEEDPDAESHPVRDFTATVEKIDAPCERIKVFTLRLEGEQIAFQAGQYVNLQVPGVEGPRAFSMANPPSRADIVELHICKVRGGPATTWLHEELQEGMKLSFSGPYGRFFIRKSAPEPILLLAGGSGISAIKSMLLDLLETGAERDITLIHGARDRAELYTRALFEDLAARHASFRYLPVLSDEPPDSGWTGPRGFVHEAAKELYGGRFSDNKAYVCGPPPMVEACVTALMRGRLFERDIFVEQFLTKSPQEERKRSPLFRKI